MDGAAVHAVVAHLGLIHGGRVRQVRSCASSSAQMCRRASALVVAGDFNDWGARMRTR